MTFSQIKIGSCVWNDIHEEMVIVKDKKRSTSWVGGGYIVYGDGFQKTCIKYVYPRKPEYGKLN